jgi:nitronate monooxygenase
LRYPLDELPGVVTGSRRLWIEYPIIQGPLGGLSSQKLTAAVSNFGGLGSLGAHSLAPNAINEAIAQIRSLTSKSFAINLWVSMEDEGAWTSDEGAFNRSLALLRDHLAALGESQPVYTPYVPMRFDNQARVLLDANVPVFSFIYGIPPREILDECRKRHIVTIGTATAPDEASQTSGGWCRRNRSVRLRSRGPPGLVLARC